MNQTFDLWSSSIFITKPAWILIFGSTTSLCIICVALCFSLFLCLTMTATNSVEIKRSSYAKMTSIVLQNVCHIKYALFMLIKSVTTIRLFVFIIGWKIRCFVLCVLVFTAGVLLVSFTCVAVERKLIDNMKREWYNPFVFCSTQRLFKWCIKN